MKKTIFIILTSLIPFVSLLGKDRFIKVCAAENFYGNVATLIGGKYVDVYSIVSNPDADPHLFSTTPEVGIKISKAQVVIFNGADYDPWFNKLLNVQPNNNKLAVINVAEIAGLKNTKNPHIWYKPDTFPKLASLLAEKFSLIQPEHKNYFKKNLSDFNYKYKKILDLIVSIKKEYNGIQVTATEPVFDYMSNALGFKMQGKNMQMVIMNDSSPSAKMRIDYLKLLSDRKVKILFYNEQVTNPTTKNILDYAKKHDIPVMGVTETMPNNKNVIEWFTDELTKVQNILKG